MPKFPNYETEDSARSNGCFVCLQSLENAEVIDSQNADGRGRYTMRCEKCGCWTFFDLRKTKEAA